MTVPRVLFLGGLGRSGTTLIERVLGELPGVTAAGEVVHLWRWGILDDERCGCGEPFRGCPFWRSVGQDAFGGGLADDGAGWSPSLARRMLALRAKVDRARYLPQLAAPTSAQLRRADLTSYVGAYRDVYAAIADCSGARVVIDSSKHSSLAYCLRHAADIDVRLVHVVRDSRGVAYSWTKEMARPEAAAGRRLMTRYTPTRSALLWNANNAALATLAQLGVPRLVVRYEDFISDPTAAVRRIAGFAGVPVSVDALSFLSPTSVRLTPAHTVAGNPMRFLTGDVTLRRDDAWRGSLPVGQQRLISALTGPMLSRYGYDVGTAA